MTIKFKYAEKYPAKDTIGGSKLILEARVEFEYGLAGKAMDPQDYKAVVDAAFTIKDIVNKYKEKE